MNPQENTADQLAALQLEFPLLDSALVAAILSDTDSPAAARQTLAELAQHTQVDDTNPDVSPEMSLGDETDPTTYSLSSWHMEDEDADGRPVDKATFLAAMFPTLSSYSIAATLERCSGDLARATDELLNRVCIAADPGAGTAMLSVDGFDVELNAANGGGNGRRARKRNGKRAATENDRPAAAAAGHQTRLATIGGASSSSSANDPPSRWEVMASEISYVAEALGLPEKTVTAAYHGHSSAVGPTIAELLERNCPSGAVLDPTHLAQLEELSAEFDGRVKRQHLEALLHLCKENMPAVFALAEALSREPKPSIQIVTAAPGPLPSTRPAPAAITTTHNWVTVGGSSATTTPTSPPPTSPRFPPAPLQTLTAQTTARNEAFANAAAWHRKSRSNPLMGGAAAYYSSVGQAYNAAARVLRDEAAERLMAANSTPDSLDLHGATVAHGVRFARERTQEWWERQQRAAELAGGGRRREPDPFQIVCGVGRHSPDGVPLLLPAVTRMLVAEGWRVVCDGGKVVVMGVSGVRARQRSF